MRKKVYLVDLKDSEFYHVNSKNASSKPRTDVEDIFRNLGFTVKTLYSRFYVKKPRNLKERILKKLNPKGIIIQSLKILFIRNSIVFVQYPFLNSRMEKIVRFIKSHNQLIVLYHDIYTVRLGIDLDIEDWLLSHSDVNIVHSEAMKNCMQKKSGKVPCVILEFFDYLTNYQERKTVTQEPVQLVFAGNLSKSNFIKDIRQIALGDDISLYLYGIPNPHVDDDSFLKYKGSFESESIDDVEGNWGLVWDGETIDGCTGNYGEYLKINAPFKFSLYLAMGIPVVVWSGSAMTRYVEAYHLGIAVDSIRDICLKIQSLTPQEMMEITEGVHCYSDYVRRGRMLEKAIQKAIKQVV